LLTVPKDRHSAGMSEDLQATVTAIVARTPDWIRQELLSKEKATRARAEEALGAMIAGALEEIEHS
jgi:hypothetical protein